MGAQEDTPVARGGRWCYRRWRGDHVRETLAEADHCTTVVRPVRL